MGFCRWKYKKKICKTLPTKLLTLIAVENEDALALQWILCNKLTQEAMMSPETDLFFVLLIKRELCIHVIIQDQYITSPSV